DLHAMPARLADDEGVVAVRLDVPPGGVVGLGGQFAEHLRVVRVGDVYEDGAAPRTGEGVFAVRLGVGPAPHVVGRARTERAARAGRDEGIEVNRVAAIIPGATALARGEALGRGGRGAEQEAGQEEGDGARVHGVGGMAWVQAKQLAPRIRRAERAPCVSGSGGGGGGRLDALEAVRGAVLPDL